MLPPTAVWASHQFTDVADSHTFHDDISWMADSGVTLGCTPGGDMYCPADNVTRGQMAAFMHRLARKTVGAREPVELFAAATVNVTDIVTSVGPIDSVTAVGAAHYRVDFGENLFDGGGTTAFITLSANSQGGTYCTYSVSAADKLDIYCWNGAEGGGQPEDAEWSLSVFSVNTLLPSL